MISEGLFDTVDKKQLPLRIRLCRHRNKLYFNEYENLLFFTILLNLGDQKIHLSNTFFFFTNPKL